MTDASVDGTEAATLGVMSQGEPHSLALSLFLPRAAAPDSPFGFVLIDDPVQSMVPTKVHGLAKVLHDPGGGAGARSVVTVRRVTDPVGQALDDARALARTPNLPPVAMTLALPGLCRTVPGTILLRSRVAAAAPCRTDRTRGGADRHGRRQAAGHRRPGAFRRPVEDSG